MGAFSFPSLLPHCIEGPTDRPTGFHTNLFLPFAYPPSLTPSNLPLSVLHFCLRPSHVKAVACFSSCSWNMVPPKGHSSIKTGTRHQQPPTRTMLSGECIVFRIYQLCRSDHAGLKVTAFVRPACMNGAFSVPQLT